MLESLVLVVAVAVVVSFVLLLCIVFLLIQVWFKVSSNLSLMATDNLQDINTCTSVLLLQCGFFKRKKVPTPEHRAVLTKKKRKTDQHSDDDSSDVQTDRAPVHVPLTAPQREPPTPPHHPGYQIVRGSSGARS